MKSRRMWVLLAITVLLSLALMPPAALSSPSRQPAAPAAYAQNRPPIRGPFVSEAVEPYVFDGDLRDLPQLTADPDVPFLEVPRPEVPAKRPPAGRSTGNDPLARAIPAQGQMPNPLVNFDGLNRSESGGWTPPDTNGDVGPNHYIQTVNIAIGIFDKVTGSALVKISYNDFFTGTGTPCDDQNRGDVIVLYDHMADRWLISDFSLPAGGPFYECLAISQSGDPVSGGWYFYALNATGSNGSWNDYPKLGVWPDAYYMSANMFSPSSGAKLWALDRAAMLIGAPLTTVSFELFNPQHWSLLPANLRGPLPPSGAPNYFANIEFPDTLNLWAFHVDWSNPGNSSLTGPVSLAVAPFGFISEIPEPPPGQMLDSLGDRLMMQLQYRNFDPYESLWVNHTIPSSGVAGVRWYEVRDPGGTPVLYQQGTYQPDDLYRWMGSLAVDGDGNMALGYSVSSESLFPSIRYAGRLYGEMPGTLPQGETSLIEGSGAQTHSDRWGDYSAMTVDPIDDCTFWYTQEYYSQTGSIWNTRIGSFRFPSCGQPKGWISGTVYDADTLTGIPGVTVVADGLTITTTLAVQTDVNGDYRMVLPAGTYTLTAGPLLPGYPEPATAAGVGVTAGATTTQDLALVPYPYLVEGAVWIDDNVPGGNNNGFPEPGESGLLLWQTISNTGATTATDVSAYLVALTPAVDITVADAAYPDISAGASMTNVTAFVFSIAPTVPCGARLDFQEIVTTSQGVYPLYISLYAKVPLPQESLFFDDMESGPGSWTTGGTNNSWTITEEQSHSPSHAWSDSPGGNYLDGTSAWLQGPILDLSGVTGVQFSFWHRYDTEAGFDFAYVEYSLDGGTSWLHLADYTGPQPSWEEQPFEASFFDDQPSASFRFLLESDGSLNADGWYIDDVDLSYEPFYCAYPAIGPAVPILLAPPDGTVTTTHAITFTWEPGVGEIVDGYNLEVDGAVYTTTETFSATVLPSGPHTWRVRAYNVAGYSNFTEPWSLAIVDPPEAPIQLAPPDDTITSSHQITFTWQAGAGGTPDSYNLELDGVVYTTTEALYTATLPAGPHTWRVRAFNAAGISDYSPSWSLTIVDLPGVPVLLAPPDGTITGTQAITFTWQAGAGGAPDGYNLELDGVVYTTTEALYTATLAAGPHTWRVRAFNAAGISDYSPSWGLTIVDPPGVPVLLAPPDGTVTGTQAITFTWQAGTGGTPDGYNLELDGTVYTTTDPMLAATVTMGPHSWQVRAFNVAGTSAYSAPWSVTVLYRVYLPLVVRGY